MPGDGGILVQQARSAAVSESPAGMATAFAYQTRGQQAVDPVLHVVMGDVVAGGDDTTLVQPAGRSNRGGSQGLAESASAKYMASPLRPIRRSPAWRRPFSTLHPQNSAGGSAKSPSVELHHNLAGAVVVDILKLADVAY